MGPRAGTFFFTYGAAEGAPPTWAAPHLVQQTVPHPHFLPTVLVRVLRTIVAAGSLQGSHLHIHIQEL